jgi:CDGSH-type Zn-finger protein
MAKITVRPNGSLFVEGDDVTIVDPAGLPIEPARRPFGLCRCGASEKKPFCDGSHNKIGFQSICTGTAKE